MPLYYTHELASLVARLAFERWKWNDGLEMRLIRGL